MEGKRRKRNLKGNEIEEKGIKGRARESSAVLLSSLSSLSPAPSPLFFLPLAATHIFFPVTSIWFQQRSFPWRSLR